jgi:glycosyltransferase involved in cell wall biosynthesis
MHALNSVRLILPNIVFEVYGEGQIVEEFLRIRNLLNLEGIVNYHGQTSLENIAEAIQYIDIGLIPYLPSPFFSLCLPTRIFEYLSLDKPVIVARTSAIQDYFDSNSIFYFEPGDKRSLEKVIVEVFQNPLKRQFVLENGLKIYENLRWDKEKRKFIQLVHDLSG